jgi:hypothetical protein
MEEKYNMSFQTGSLLRAESIKLAELYLEAKDWSDVRSVVARDNVFQSRTQSSSSRIAREIVARLKELSDDELRFLIVANSADQGYLLWVAICRRYRFIAEFATEVIREKYLSLQPSLTGEEFDLFFGRKCEWHPELETLAPQTRNKWRQVILLMLREADLVSSSGAIHPAMLSSEFMELLSRNGGHDIAFFAIFEADVRRVSL